MAAYGALVSLMNTVDDIRNHPRLSTSLNNYQIVNLGKKLDFFLHFVENHHGGISKEVAEDLESRIARAAHTAEVVIESHIAYRIHNPQDSSTSLRSITCVPFLFNRKQNTLDLQNVIQHMDSIEQRVIKAKEESGFKHLQSATAASSRSYTAGKTSMVGFDDYLYQLLDWLTGQQSQRRIIPITGMGGIGKTTLASYVYQHLLIVQHFDKRAWVTVSQEYNVKQILYSLVGSTRDESTGQEFLSSLGGSINERTEEELGGQLHKNLFGRRYLIIIDDMWSIDAWERLKFFFPENNNRSRIVVTTRQPDVASLFGSLALALSFLDDYNSWNLFSKKAFAQEDCPAELEGTGRNIVKKCRGLPLSLVVIGGLLGKSPKTQECWRNVEKDLSSILNSAEDSLCFNMLSLSYSYLPARLKPCFLYLGTFPEDDVIPVSLVIKLWVAEGFLKPDSDQSLEEVGERYIMDLVDRSLVLVHRLRWDHTCISFKVHDLLRELCLKIAKKEKFFCMINEVDTSRATNREGRIGVIVGKGNRYYDFLRAYIPVGSTSLASFELVRALCNASVSSLDTTFEQVSLRFLDGYNKDSRHRILKLPSSISQVWNLQTLLIRHSYVLVEAPSEIWEMPNLRHVDVNWICLPDPPLVGKQCHVGLRNLQTLETVSDLRCTEEVCKRMTNVKKLRIKFSEKVVGRTILSYYCLYNIGKFTKLESLHYHFSFAPYRYYLTENLKFPNSLKELTLSNCGLHWDDLTIIGTLPHLEYLKLEMNSVSGSEWNPVDGEFLGLKFLGVNLYNSGFVSWNADSCHFPVLEELHLSLLEELNEIPWGIGEIPTLRVVTMSNCSVSTVISAVKILEEQESLGNDGLQVEAKFWNHKLVEEVRENVEEEGFPTHNFLLSSSNTPSLLYFGSANPTIC